MKAQESCVFIDLWTIYDRCFRIIDVHRREVRRHDEREIEEICVSSRIS